MKMREYIRKTIEKLGWDIRKRAEAKACQGEV